VGIWRSPVRRRIIGQYDLEWFIARAATSRREASARRRGSRRLQPGAARFTLTAPRRSAPNCSPPSPRFKQAARLASARSQRNSTRGVSPPHATANGPPSKFSGFWRRQRDELFTCASEGALTEFGPHLALPAIRRTRQQPGLRLGAGSETIPLLPVNGLPAAKFQCQLCHIPI